MKKTLRLTESELIQIIKRIIKEEGDPGDKQPEPKPVMQNNLDDLETDTELSEEEDTDFV